MPAPIDPSLPTSNDVEFGVATSIDDLDVRGTIPPGLSGRLLGIGPDPYNGRAERGSRGGCAGVVHSIGLDAGQALWYRSRRVRTDAALRHVVGFGDSILAFGDDSPAYELSPDFGWLRRVDLAGQSRAVAVFPKRDPATGDLHLIARTDGGTHAHVVVSAGALTRHSRPVLDVPNRITDLALTRDRVVFVADGFVGVTARDGDARTAWITTGAAAPLLVDARDAGNTVVVLAVTPSLEQWTLHTDDGTVRREVLDPTPRRFAHTNDHRVDGVARLLWTTGNGTVGQHDLATGRHMHRSLRPHVPGDLVFVPDAARPADADGGWLVGLVHDTSRAVSELRVIDAADIARPALATVRIPCRIPVDLGCTWIPSNHQ